MKFDGKNIGGMETGPIRFGFRGNEKLGQQYVPIARQFVGDLKRRMELSQIEENAVYQQEDFTTLPDGTVIYANSIFGGEGAADIDDVIIDTRKTVRKPKKEHVCFGYVVLGMFKKSGADYGFSVTLPSGDKFGYLYMASSQWSAEFDGFPDYNAKYINFTGDPDHQIIIVNKGTDETLYQYNGPTTVKRNDNLEIDAGFYDWGGTSVANSISFSFQQDLGTCGTSPETGQPWTYLSAVNPFRVHYDVTPVRPCETAPHDTIMDYATLVYPVAWYTGGFYNPNPLLGCVANFPGPEHVTAGAWTAKWSYDNEIPIVVAALNYQNQLTYENYISCFNYTDEVFAYYAEMNGQCQNAIKRVDDKGVYSPSGFHISNGKLILSNPSTQYGNGALIMIPLKGENYSFEYDAEVISENQYEYFSDWAKALTLGSSTAMVGRLEHLNPDYPNETYPLLHHNYYYEGNVYAWDPALNYDPVSAIDPSKYTANPDFPNLKFIIVENEYDENGTPLAIEDRPANILSSSESRLTVQEYFGANCKVEAGWHSIIPQGQVPVDEDIRVYLFTSAGVFVKDFTRETIAPAREEVMRIFIGPFKDTAAFSDVIEVR